MELALPKEPHPVGLMAALQAKEPPAAKSKAPSSSNPRALTRKPPPHRPQHKQDSDGKLSHYDESQRLFS
jgi:hypothetical protein